MRTLVSYLNPGTVAVALLAFCISYLLVGAIVNYRKLSQFRGPPLAGYSRLWLFWQSVNSRVHTAEYEALEKYGCPARIGPDVLVVNDPDMIRAFNAPGSKWRRSGWFDAMRFDPRYDTVFSTRDERVHADLKAKEVGAYNGRDIHGLESDIDDQVVALIDLIKSRYNGITMDLADVFRYFTLDVLSTVSFGRPFGFMAANADLWDYSKANAEFFPLLELMANHKSINWLINTRLMQWLAAPKVTDKSGIGPALAFARKAVSERFGEQAKVGKDMLGHFVEKGLSPLQCEVAAFLQILAGSDSTTSVLRCTMYLLLANPSAYSKLRADVDRTSQNGGLSYPVATYSEAQKLPFVTACIWEGLRMYPPLFGFKSKLAPPGGDTIKGVYFPAGTEVATCDSSMSRRKDLWGADANIFRPERWIEASPEQRQTWQKAQDAMFGGGRFMCLGRHIAMIELHKAIVELMRNFDWTIVDPMAAVPTTGNTVFRQRDMNVIAWPR